MRNYISIAGRKIGPAFPPYIIAELSANHNGDIDRAIAVMMAAKKSGADAIKLQTYTADTITLNLKTDDFMVKGGLWDGQSLHELYQQGSMPWDWHKPLFEKARQIGITIFSSPFDRTAVDLLEDLNAPAYKVASFEIIDLPLIAYMAKTGKPLIISTGMASPSEIEAAIDTARSSGCKELVVLHCISGYPTPPEQYNLRTISDIAQKFNVLSGLSDHTIDNTTAITSVAMGAVLIEKHVTLDRSGGGVDDSFSIEPSELNDLCRDTKVAWSSLGKVNYELTEAEKPNIKFRRSLYFVKKLSEGDIITEDSVRSVRPGYGIAPRFLDQVIGATVSCDVNYGQPVTKDSYVRHGDDIGDLK